MTSAIQSVFGKISQLIVMSDNKPVCSNRGDGELRVPGFGLPIDYWISSEEPEYMNQHKNNFRHGVNDFKAPRMTVKELAMLSLMNALTDKSDWVRKVRDESIVAKWRQEALENPLMSDQGFDWCINELNDKAAYCEKVKFVKTLDNASVCVKTDNLVSVDTKKELQQAVKHLIEQPHKDWHPKSDDQVLNLVHPSLFPLVYGRTRVLREGIINVQNCLDQSGKGEIVPEGQVVKPKAKLGYSWRDADTTKQWSTKFQWLPCEIKFTGEVGTDVEITSYVNNLHPTRERSIYRIVEKLIAASIQPWNEVLIKGWHGREPLRIRTYGADFEPADVPEWAANLWNVVDRADERMDKVRAYVNLPDNPDLDLYPFEDYPANWEQDEDWSLGSVMDIKYRKIRRVVHPEPGLAYDYNDWKLGKTDSAVVKSRSRYSALSEHTFYDVSLETQFREQGLQVIVKLASIELTPEKPNYGGGNWHLEGMLNEHIVATSIYYYDVENVTESRIRFRQEADLDDMSLDYEQSDHAPLCQIFGTESMTDEKAVQEIGSITTPEGRLLAFPNTLQHRVEPFRLADATRPGHRRFLVLWLVDPHLRIMSTANVPPQQHEWWADETLKTGEIPLPAELRKMVVDVEEDWPMSLEEAKKLRLELMEERTSFGREVEKGIGQYNLCEH